MSSENPLNPVGDGKTVQCLAWNRHQFTGSSLLAEPRGEKIRTEPQWITDLADDVREKRFIIREPEQKLSFLPLLVPRKCKQTFAIPNSDHDR